MNKNYFCYLFANRHMVVEMFEKFPQMKLLSSSAWQLILVSTAKVCCYSNAADSETSFMTFFPKISGTNTI